MLLFNKWRLNFRGIRLFNEGRIFGFGLWDSKIRCVNFVRLGCYFY